VSPPYDGAEPGKLAIVAIKKATKKSRNAIKGPKGPRWQKPRDRWSPTEDPGKVAEQFLTAAQRLILRGKPPEESSETELLGWRIAIRLQLAFQSVPDHSYVVVLRKALDAFDHEPTDEMRRAWCVRAVAEWGENWKHPDWQSSEKTRALCLEQLVRYLEVNDEVFSGLRDDLPGLAAKLDAWTPARARGKKVAERILSELIVEDRDALGLGPKDGEADVDAIERIRKLLTKEVDSFLNRSRPTKTA